MCYYSFHFQLKSGRCDEDPVSGLRSICKAAFPKVYYDKENNECKSFIYGGCGANRNIFITIEECEKLCKQPETS